MQHLRIRAAPRLSVAIASDRVENAARLSASLKETVVHIEVLGIATTLLVNRRSV